MPIIRKQLKPSDVYPTDIRYNTSTGHVQSLINGTWTDNPEADPRNQTTFPPRATADTTCDAAQSVADAFKNQIDGVLTAIAGSQTAFTIAGIILSLFTFGVFGIFISLALFLAHTMLDAGSGAINAALTTTVYHTFMCILDCRMDADGRIPAGSMGAVQSDVSTQIGGLGADILNAMLSLAGEGGVNNLAALGTSTGDCSDCGCGSCGDDWVAPAGGYLAPTFGTDGGGFYVQAVANNFGGGFFAAAAKSPDDVACCTINHVDIVSGTATNRLGVLCGGSTLTPAVPDGTCVRLMYQEGTEAFTVRWYLTQVEGCE